MRILVVHTRYQEKGGEDAVFDAEYQLLAKHGLEVDKLEFYNDEIGGIVSQVKFGIKSIKNPKSISLLKDKIASFKPDVIHFHNLFYVASPALLKAAKEENLPVVMTLHNYRLICSSALLMRNNVPCHLCVDKKFPLNGIFYRCNKNSFLRSTQVTLITSIHKSLGTWKNYVDKYITLTDFALDTFTHSSLQIDANKIVVKPNFVNDIQNNSQPRQDYFLYIGRLSPEKGIKLLLEAFSIVDFEVRIIGDGPLKHEVEKAANKNKNISYLGFQDKSFISSQLNQCKALIFPSTWYEGMPITILEAFSTGTPVIASDLNNINSIIIPTFNGWLFKTGDVEDLANKVREVDKTSEWLKLSEGARKSYLENYSPEVNFKLLVNIYKDL